MSINYGKQFIDKKDINAVVSTLKSDFLTQGPKVQEFERELNKFCGSKFSCAVSSGTAALHLAVIALGVKKNDIVLTTPITFLASANAILYAGAKPVFIDIDEKNYCIDINKLEKQIVNFVKQKKKIKAAIITDFAGHVCDWEKISYLSKKYNFFTINDNCHAFGAKYKNSNKYASKFADIVTLSFHPVKIITTCEGGAVLTNNKIIDNKIRILRTHGVIRNRKLTQTNGHWYYEMIMLGFNYRLSDVQASLGISQLKKINKFLKKRKRLAKFYNDKFKNNSLLKIPHVESYCEHAYHIYPLQINFNKLKINKIKFFSILKKKGYNLQVHYRPIYQQKYYKTNFNYNKNNFPISNNYYKNSLSLPIYYNLKNKTQKKIINIINNLCFKYKINR